MKSSRSEMEGNDEIIEANDEIIEIGDGGQ